MPLEFEIDPELNALVVRVHGVVGSSDFKQSIDQIASLPGFKPDMNQLLDFAPGALDLAENASRALADFFESGSVRETLGSNYKLELVAEREIDFGQLRMYEVHFDHARSGQGGVEARVFYSLEEAKRWLRGPPPTPVSTRSESK